MIGFTAIARSVDAQELSSIVAALLGAADMIRTLRVVVDSGPDLAHISRGRGVAAATASAPVW
jgi:hypothetical protein